MKKVSIWCSKLLAAGVIATASIGAHAEAVDPSTLLSGVDFSTFNSKLMLIGGGIVILSLIIAGIYVSLKAVKPAKAA
jgi:hypothetical protein